MLNAGCTCPKCRNGRMRTISSRQAGEQMQLRYLECTQCGERAKSLTPAQQVFRRSTVEPQQAS